MLWINCIFSIVSCLVIIASGLCEERALVNLEYIRMGLKPKYNPKKLSLWSSINLIIAIISLAVIIINSVIIILN